MANAPLARSVTSAGPRVFPAGKAIMLLAACAPELAGRRMTIDGRRIHTIRFARLVLLVTYVDQKAYGQDEIERRRPDRAWLAAEARFFERAVERAGAHGSVLPMRLLTTFAHVDLLEEHALGQDARWSRALARLQQRRECAVHLFAGPHVPPGSLPYVTRIAQRAVRSARAPAVAASDEIAAHALRLWNEIAALAVATRRIGSAGRGSLWSAALLLEPQDVTRVATVLQRSIAGGAPLGVMAYLEEPRLPFTFV